jgi:anti-sigma regulatory factor (Ser/Thr protein kinase)
MARVQREFDGELRQLASMRAFLREVCQHAQPTDEEMIHRLELALTEAASNIILHSYADQLAKPITVTIEADDNQVSMTLRHTGNPFDPQAVAEPVFDGSKESGFGLYLIRQCVDEVQYRQDADGQNVMHLILKRRRRES